MKRTIICSIPMKRAIQKTVYATEDQSIPAAQIPVRFPAIAYLASVLHKEDEVKVVMIEELDEYSHYSENVDLFKEELSEINEEIGASISYQECPVEFNQKKSRHEGLLGKIVEAIDIGSSVVADITYGSKDIPIILFSALSFAEKFLKISVDHIVYDQASFDDKGNVKNTVICDMLPLFYLSSVTNVVRCDDPDKAKEILKMLLSI